MRKIIIQKIKSTIEKLDSEADLVYLLTRIGIVIEVDSAHKKYSILYFYRNWVVHNKIDNVKPIKTYLDDFIHKNKKEVLLKHKPLIDELTKFLKEHNIESLRKEQKGKFLNFLKEVITDIPLIIKSPSSEYKLSFKRPSDKKTPNAYLLSVTVHVEPLKLKLSLPPVMVINES